MMNATIETYKTIPGFSVLSELEGLGNGQSRGTVSIPARVGAGLRERAEPFKSLISIVDLPRDPKQGKSANMWARSYTSILWPTATDDIEFFPWARVIFADVLTSCAGIVRNGCAEIPEGHRLLGAASRVSDPLHNVRRMLRSFSKRKHAWDGYDGVPAEQNAVQEALIFLQAVPTPAPLPRPGLAGDGEVGLFWDYGRGFIDIGFLGDGTYSYYGRDKSGREIFGDNSSLDEGIAEDLREFIGAYE